MLTVHIPTSNIRLCAISSRSSRVVSAPCQQRTEVPTAPGAKQLDPALLSRLEKAKQYKSSLNQSGAQQASIAAASVSAAAAREPSPASPDSNITSTAASTPSFLPDQQTLRVEDLQRRPASDSVPNAANDASLGAHTPGMFEPRPTNRGSSGEAAYWLKAVLSEEAAQGLDGLDAATLRPEEFTRLKEARTRATQQVEIISVDKNYRPKVSTWGVFARPDNISEAFGGGRNIEPGQELESEEQTKARRARTNALLDEYKKKAGTLIDPEVEVECDALYQEADELFRLGLLQAAYEKYDAITKKVVTKTRIGGLATLQKALCLDSLGKNEEARPMYKYLALHPNPSVSKKAKQLLFGFDAANFLKANTIDFSGKKKAWAKYFTRNSGFVYVQTEEEREKDEAAMRAASAVAVAVMVGPFAAFAVAALNK